MHALNDSAGQVRVGVAGMGTMGTGMACSLIKAGFDVCVYNRTREKCRPAAELGARVQESISQLAAAVDFVVLMLSDDAAVEAAVAGENGILAGGRPGQIVLNCSTVLPETNQKLAQQLDERGIALLDAPVTGSRPQAETGQLYFLIGGPEAIYLAARPLLEAMGRGHLHLGPVGSGACAKLANNFMGFINLCGLSEAIEFTSRFGLAPEKFLQVVSNSGGRSVFSEIKGPKILAGNWSPDFALKLAAKDLRLAYQVSRQQQLPLQMLSQAAAVYAQAQEPYGELDVCSLIRWYRDQHPPLLS